MNWIKLVPLLGTVIEWIVRRVQTVRAEREESIKRGDKAAEEAARARDEFERVVKP